MPLSSSPLSYQDIHTILDRALTAPNGIKVTLESHGKAIHFRQRVYKYRLIDRNKNSEIYPEGHNMHGVSEYDVLVCQVEKGSAEARITRTSGDGYDVEDL